MKTFASFIKEATLNKIPKESREVSVVGNKKYNSPTDFKKSARKIGNIGELEIHRADNEQGGTTHFTYHPGEKKVHHVVHAVQSTSDDTGTKLKYLSAHGREGSPVKMGQVYTKLMKDHDTEFTGTGHSPGAAKMWDRFHDDPDVEVLGRNPDTGETIKLNKGDRKYGDLKSKDPAERKLGKMQLIARKKPDNMSKV